MGRKKDEFDFDGDMFPMDDFDMDDLLGNSKPPKGIKAVFKGIKNFGKWYIGGTIDDLFPNTKELVSLPVELGKELGSQISDLNDKYKFKETLSKKLGDVKATAKEEVTKLKSSIKDGTFFTESAEDKMMKELFSDSDDSSFGGSEESSEEKSEKRSKKTVKAIGKGTDILNKSIQESGNLQRKQSAKQFEVRAKLDTTMHSQMFGVVSNIAGNVVRLVKQNNLLIKTQVEYSSKSLKLMSAQAKLLQDLRSAQWKMIGKKKVDITNPKKRVSAVDIFGTSGNEFDQMNYIAYMSQQLREAMSENLAFSLLTSLVSGEGSGDLIKMSGGYTGLAKSMVGEYVRKKINNSVFSASTRAMFNKIEKYSKNVLPQLNKKLKNIADYGYEIPEKITGVKAVDNILKKILGNDELVRRVAGLFAIRDTSYNPVKTKNFVKDEVHAFDNEAHRTLVEVIPGLLSKIYAATSGQPEIYFDYSTGKFVTAKSIKDKIVEKEKEFIRSAGNSSEASAFKKYSMQNISDKVDRNSRIKKGDKEAYKSKIQDAYDMIVHNYLFYGFDTGALKELEKDVRKKSGDDFSDYFLKITKGIVGDRQTKIDAVRFFIESENKLRKENPLAIQSFEGVANTYKSRMTKEMQDFQENLEKNTNAGGLYTSYMSSKSTGSLESIRKRTEEINKKLAELRKGAKKDSMGGIILNKAGKALENKLVKELDQLQARYNTLTEEGSAKIHGFEDSATINSVSDFTTSRMADVDSTTGLLKNIHDILLEGVVVYPKKMGKEVEGLKEKRLASFKERANALISDQIQNERNKKDYEEYKKQYRNARYDVYKDGDDDMAELENGPIHDWLRKEGTLRGRFFRAFDDKMTKGTNKVLSTLLKFAGFEEGSDAYNKAMENNVKVKESKSVKENVTDKINSVFKFAEDVGVSKEKIDKVKTKADEFVNSASAKASSASDKIKQKMADAGAEEKMNTVKDKASATGASIKSKAKEAFDKAKTKMGFNKIVEEAEKVSDEAVKKAEEVKKEAVESICQTAKSAGIDIDSDEVQSEINRTEKKIDEAVAVEVEATSGTVAAKKTREKLERARLIRKRKHIITGSLGFGLDAVGGLFSMLGGGLDSGGRSLRDIGKSVRDFGKEFGTVGKLLGGAAGLVLSGTGLLMQGTGKINKAKGAVLTGLGKGVRGVGKGVTGLADILTYPVRLPSSIIKNALKRKKEGRATPGDDKILSNAQKMNDPKVNKDIAEATVAESKSLSATSETVSRESNQTNQQEGKKKSFLPRLADKFASSKSSVGQAVSGFVGGVLGIREGSREDQIRDKREEVKLEQEKIMADSSKKMVDYMTNPKHGGILVRFSKEGLRDYDDVQEENMQELGAAGLGAGGGALGLLGAIGGSKLLGGIKSAIGRRLGKTKVGKFLGFDATTGKRVGFVRRGVRKLGGVAKKGLGKAGKGIKSVLGKTVGKTKVGKGIGSGVKAASGAVKSVGRMAKGAVSTVKGAIGGGAKAAAKSVGKTATKKAGLLSKFTGFIGKLIKKLAPKLGKFGGKLMSFFTKGLSKVAAKGASALSGVLAKFATTMGLSASGVGTLVGIAMWVVPVVAAFAKGMTRTRSMFGLGAGATIPMGMRLAAGCAEALDSGLFGLPSLISDLVYGGKYKTLAEMFFYEVFGDEATKQGIMGYNDYNRKRAKIYGITNPDALIKYENGGNLALNALTKFADAFTLGLGNTDNRRKASILGFGSVRAFEEWESKKYKPLEELRKKIGSSFGSLRDLDSISSSDPEKQAKYREEFLKAATAFVKAKDLGWLTDKTTEEEVEARLGKRSKLAFLKRNPLVKGVVAIKEKIDAKKTASDFLKDQKNQATKDQPGNQMMVDAEGNVSTLGGTIQQEIEKYRAIAKERGVEGHIDDAQKLLNTSGITDAGVVRQVLEAAVNAGSAGEAKKAMEKIISDYKSGKSSTTTQATTEDSTKVSTTASTVQNETPTSVPGEGISPSTSTNELRTTGTLNGSPAKTAVLKLSSEMSEIFKYSKQQLDESLRHNKIVEASFEAMIKLLGVIASKSGASVQNVLDDLSREIASST